MSKEFKNIDQLYQSELNTTPTKAPKHVKQNIDLALHSSSNKIGWWLAIPVIIVLISIPFFYNSPSSSNDVLTSNKPISHTLDDKKTVQNEQFNNSINKEIIASSSEKIENHTRINESSITSPNSESNQFIKPKKENGVNVNYNLSTNIVSNNLVITDKKILNESKIKSNPIIEGDSVTTVLFEKDELKSNEIINIPNPTSNEIQEIDSTSSIVLVDSSDSDLPDPDVEIDLQTEQYSPWFLSLTTGVNLKKSNMSSDLLTEATTYETQITDKIGNSALFEASYRFKNSLTFGAGIGYTALYETYNYYKLGDGIIDTTISYLYFQDSIADTPGWIYFTDSTATETYTYGQVEYYNANGTNSNTYLNIPIKIGTQLDFNKWRIDLFVAGRFNLLISSKTTYVVNNQLVNSSNAGFKNSYFDLVFGTSIHYSIYDNLYFTGTMRYKPSMRSNYYSDGISNKFQNLHLGVGLSLSL